jgi:hypothetical protein
LQATGKKIGYITVISLLLIISSFSVTANAQRYTWVTLTVNVNMSGAGWVSPGTGNYYYGQELMLNAYTRSGYSFDGWFIDGVYQGKLSSMPLTVTRDSVIDAVFSKRVVGLTISVNPPEAATLAPNPGVYTYTYGDSVNVKQYPNSGYTFSGYYLDGEYIGLGTGITVYMDKDRQLTAYYQGGLGNTTIPTLAPTATVAATPEPTPTPNLSLPQPDLVFFCTSSSQYAGFNVKIGGRLSYNDVGISGAGVIFSYSVTGGATWQDLAYVITDDIGGFSAVWMPFATGNYMIRATWAGDDVLARVSKTVNYAIVDSSDGDSADASIFSVTSNSTVSSFAFDSTAGELSFGVSGPSGTDGYVQVSIPKTMLSDISTLAVKVDDVKVQYNTETRNNVWLISFVYHHSSHDITLALYQSSSSSSSPNNSNFDVTSNPWMIIAIVAIVVAVIAIVMSLRVSRKKHP